MKHFQVLIILLFACPIMANTEITEEAFKVTLPGEWQLVDQSDEEGLWAYENQAQNQRLTVSLLYFKSEPTHSQMKQVIDQFISVRREQTLSVEAKTEQGKVTIKEFPAAWLASYKETGPQNRNAHNKTICTQIGLINFYYEAFIDKEEYEKNADIIMSSTGFAS